VSALREPRRQADHDLGLLALSANRYSEASRRNPGLVHGNAGLTRDAPPGGNITQAQARNESFDDCGGI
jgi:hypothetical protein